MPETSLSYLVMRVDQYRLALPVTEVAEICRPVALQQVAQQPDVRRQHQQQDARQRSGLLGFAMLRGVPTPVLDAAVLLGLGRSSAQHSGIEADARLVRIRMARQDSAPCAALLVDSVAGVYPIAAADVRAVALPGAETQHLGEFDQQLARLLDASSLIGDEAWEQISAAVPSTRAAAAT